MPKRLLLCNLKELYVSFKTEFPDISIGFSKFAELRPKWCISVGPKGTHSACVCTIHQNLKLMLSAVELTKTYHELVDMLVCSSDSKVCMVHRCAQCPDENELYKYLREQLIDVAVNDETNDGSNDNTEGVAEEESEMDDDEEEVDETEEEEENVISFKQWTTVDRAELITMSLPVEEFFDTLIESLNNITTHYYNC